jgi:hypothetical protein
MLRPLLPCVCLLLPSAALLGQDLTTEVQHESDRAVAMELGFQQLLAHAEATGEQLTQAKAAYVAADLAALQHPEPTTAPPGPAVATPTATTPANHDQASPTAMSAPDSGPPAAVLALLEHERVRLNALLATSPELTQALTTSSTAQPHAMSSALAALLAAVHAYDGLAERLQAAREHRDTLHGSITELTPKVAAQKAGEKKTRNQEILAKAQSDLDDLSAQIDAIATSEKDSIAAIAQFTGGAAADAVASARALIQRYQHALRLLADIHLLGKGLAGICAKPTVSAHGLVTRERVGSEAVRVLEGVDAVLEAGDRLTTGPGSWVSLTLQDGSHLTLGERSNLTIEVRDDKPCASLTSGVVRFLDQLGSRRILVRTPASVAAVRGTDFLCEQNAEQTVYRVHSGHIELSMNGLAPCDLGPGQRATIHGDGSVLVEKDADGYDLAVDGLDR